jgi:hypothetical protein
MVHVHGRRAQRLVEPLRRIPPEQVIAVAVDAGKRGVKTDVVDATAMFDLLAAGSRDTGGCCESGDHRAGCVGAVPPWAGRVAP